MKFSACLRNGPARLALSALLGAAVLCLPAGGAGLLPTGRALAQQAAAGKLQPAPLPPPRPASLGPRGDGTAGTAQAQASAQASAQAAAQAPAQVATAPAAGREPLSDKAGVDLLNSYFNSYPVLSADFIQVGADGRRYEGKLYIQRPGKMRFEYKAPATIEIIADGTSVAIRDRKLATQDLYAIAQTPLKFLLKDKIDLSRDTTIKNVSSTRDALNVQLEDKATLGGTSKIALQYDRVANVLRQWTIVDPQGYETSVSIFNVDTQRRHDQRLFAINYERMLEDRK